MNIEVGDRFTIPKGFPHKIPVGTQIKVIDVPRKDQTLFTVEFETTSEGSENPIRETREATAEVLEGLDTKATAEWENSMESLGASGPFKT